MIWLACSRHAKAAFKCHVTSIQFIWTLYLRPLDSIHFNTPAMATRQVCDRPICFGRTSWVMSINSRTTSNLPSFNASGAALLRCNQHLGFHLTKVTNKRASSLWPLFHTIINTLITYATNAEKAVVPSLMRNRFCLEKASLQLATNKHDLIKWPYSQSACAVTSMFILKAL